MLSNLNEIVERLVKGYDPERIILFGSHADGVATEQSDVDLMILKETQDRPVDRRMTVERLLADRALPLDLLVYTPSEFYRLYTQGSPLIQEITEKGKILYMRNLTQSWMQEAQEHLESGRLLLENGLPRPACYHCQQCVEKVLKGLLIEKGRKPARTHDILDLLREVHQEGWEPPISIDQAVLLNSIFKGRYPSEEGLLPRGEPSVEDARNVLTAANSLMSFLLALSRFSE